MQAWLLDKNTTILVENGECSVCKNKAGGLFPCPEFSHEAPWKLSTQPASGLENWDLTVALSLLFQLFTLYPVTQYIHTHCHGTLKCPPTPGSGIGAIGCWPTSQAGLQCAYSAGLICLPPLPKTWAHTWVTTGSRGLTGDMWNRSMSQTKLRSAPLPSQAQPGSANLHTHKHRSASRGGRCDGAVACDAGSLPSVNWSITRAYVTLGKPFPACAPLLIYKVRGGVEDLYSFF